MQEKVNAEENLKNATQRGQDSLEEVKAKEGTVKSRSKILKIGFWNVAGIGRKNLQFWDYTNEYDFIGLVETWMEEDWKKTEKTLPKEFKWKAVPARREHKKGRAKGGIITGVKKHLLEEDSNIETDHAQERTIKVQKKRIRILTVYTTEEREKTWQVIKDNYKKPEEDVVIIGGDFNARTGNKGATRARKSKDKKINKRGREFLEILREKNWTILNGSTAGDEDGNFTFVSASGSSVIDYAVANCLALKDVKHFEVEKRTESDHMPIKITLELNSEESEWEEKDKNETKMKGDANKEYEDLIKAIEML